MRTIQKRNGNHRKIGYKHYVRILGEHKKELPDRYTVKEIGICGSCVRGEERVRSDIDILVDFVEAPEFSSFMSLADFLERILHRKIDLVRKPIIRKELRDQVLNEVIYV